MDSTFGMSGGSDQKSAIMNQVRQEAAMNNARQLIEVLKSYILNHILINNLTESQRTLLREMRAQTRLFIIERRNDLLHSLYGEIYGCLEHG
jgi:hypothetical protein